MSKISIQQDWTEHIGDMFSNPAMKRIGAGIQSATDKHGIDSIYPRKDLMFKAFEITPLNNVNVVFIGLEPTAETASGLFSESQNGEMSSALTKMYNVYSQDYPTHFNTNIMSGVVSHWARQSILLLNLSLSARAGQPKRHLSHWSFFIDKVLQVLISQDRPILFVPFGSTPIEKLAQLDIPLPHRVMEFKLGFFLDVNKWLDSVGHTPIEW